MAVLIDSPADVQRLLEVARGRHAQSAPYRFMTTAAVLLVLGMSSFLAAGTRTAGPLIAFAVSLVIMAVVLFQAYSAYEVSPAAIECFSPFGRSAWRIGAGEIHKITLSLQRGWTMQIETSSGKRRVFSLPASLQDAIGSLYPTVKRTRFV